MYRSLSLLSLAVFCACSDSGTLSIDGTQDDVDSTDTDTTADTTETADTTDSTDTTETADTTEVAELPHFSFFVTSLAALQRLSGSQDGFGGDLRFGETGPGAGLRGADAICASIAETSMPGAGAKGWRAFLSATADENGAQVNAIDRIGPGPWYDRYERLVANDVSELLNERPVNADPEIIDDLPNEDGVPNHRPDPGEGAVDNHDTLTGSNTDGELYGPNATCLDWTSAAGTGDGKPRVGHSWPRRGFPGGGGGGPGGDMNNWISALTESGCAPGVNLVETGPPDPRSNTVGSGGGYGGFYCFALTP